MHPGCRIHPFLLVYNLCISWILPVDILVFIADSTGRAIAEAKAPSNPHHGLLLALLKRQSPCPPPFCDLYLILMHYFIFEVWKNSEPIVVV